MATSNGVNFTDGLDGLAGGTLIFAFVAYMIIAAAQPRRWQPNLAILCALIIGALLGFLWFNVHPAQVFMGDSGSLALGATLAVTALITGQILLLPLIGIIFVLRAASDILQIGYYKLTAASASSGWRRCTTTSSSRAGTKRRSRCASGSWASSPRMLGVAFFLATGGQAGMTAGRASSRIDLRRCRSTPSRGRPVAVLGLARSGIALARFLADRGARVTVYDARPAAELGEAMAALEGRDVRLAAAGPAVDPAAALDGQALIPTSPCDQQPLPDHRAAPAGGAGAVEAAGRVPVVSEVDLFLRLCPATTVGVTGTKGKTTTAR